MRTLFLAAAASLALASPAHAITVLFDDFDGEAGGTTQLNYSSFANFNVVADSGAAAAGTPTVDLLRQPNGFSLGCAGGAGSCVDLDGSTGNGGRLITQNAFAFNAGDTITLSLDLSGSQRGSADDFGFGFSSASGVISFQNVLGSVPGLYSAGPSSFNNSGFFFTGPLVPSGFGFTNSFVSFRAGTAGSVRAFAQTTSNDNIGPIIDNFRLDITPDVPEPATWLSMILGFGLMGTALRRKQGGIAKFA